MQAPFAPAFTAGLVASVNPCGFAMLPAYLSFLIGTDDDVRGPAEVGAGPARRVDGVGWVPPGVRCRRPRVDRRRPLHHHASLSCTLPVFLVVVGSAGTQGSLLAGTATFATYAAGMALPLLGFAVALALGKDAFVRRVRGLAR